MSKLEELISELCPDGVEYKTLGEIATDIYRGSGITRDQVTPTGTPCVRYGEIYTTYGIWFEKCVSFTNENTITNKKYFKYGDLLFVMANLARHLKIDPEAALKKANSKFQRRFAHIEARLAEQGIPLAEAGLERMDALWNEARAADKKRT